MGANALLLVVGLFAVVSGDAAKPAADVDRHFESKVRPILVEHCLRCHGAEKTKGGLRLDSGPAMNEGGDTGPAVVPGDPGKSLLIEAVRYNADLKMPPKGKLADAEIAALVTWVSQGATWPQADAPQPAAAPEAGKPATPRPIDASWWAFQPPTHPAPPVVKNPAWPRSDLDRFILAALENRGLEPAPRATKRDLIRRVTYDLVGLPPTPEQVDAFLADDSPEALSRVVDRLLASPRYGERWGRHWLDLARYADSNGMDENVAYANAYRYRDYVVNAFNADMPYDQFLREQLAGDLLPNEADPQVNYNRLTATGFLVIGPKMLAEDDPVKMEMDIIDEQVDTIGRVFMGMTFGCARCHDHKFDPVSTADYYGMAGIFKSTRTMQNHKVVAMWNQRMLASPERKTELDEHKKQVEKLNARIRMLQKKAKDHPDDKSVEATLKSTREELKSVEDKAPEVPEAMGVEDREITNLKIHIRGNHLTLGAEVPRRFPTVFTAGESPEPLPSDHSGRKELADWLARPDHPLTARVMVNRIWASHFGHGLVRSVDNFGRLGETPTHPELLDWLGNEFVKSGWSIKAMHRRIILSATYQMSTQATPEALASDPDNRLMSHFNRHRLEAEAVRDGLLAVSGLLEDQMGGSLLPTKNHAYVSNTASKDPTFYDPPRRSIYLPIIRSGVYDVFQAFDFADPSTSNGLRIPTTVAPQALFMLNDRLMLRASQRLAESLLSRPDLDPRTRLDEAYRRALSRTPTDSEARRDLEYLSKFESTLESLGVAPPERPRRSWQVLCQSILASSEFLYLD